ncbi:PYK [Symbiodinium natans]|uniref:PYK protein n=1 Tax=Symbiodinium natans TaxID=878477 RepID=A0A812QC34_9DINO|nr:PYK [Symbiodinium natans]
MSEPNVASNISSESSSLRHAVEEEEPSVIPSLSGLETAPRDVECRISSIEQRSGFKAASQSRITAMLQLLVEDRLLDTLGAASQAGRKLPLPSKARTTSLPLAPCTSSSLITVRAEQGNRLLMESQSAPGKPAKLMQVLPEGEQAVLPRQAGSVSVRQVVAEQAAARLRASSRISFEVDLPLLLQGPESRFGSCCFKFWRGVLAVCGVAAMWDSSRTDAARRCRHFLHVAVTVVLSMLAVWVGLLRFVSLVPQEAEPWRDLTSKATSTTDIVLGLAAPMCLSFLGGVTPGTYARRTDYMRDSLRYLGNLLKDNNLIEEWRDILGKDLMRLTVAWFSICTLRVASTLLLHDLSAASVSCMVGFVVFASVLAAVGFVLIATWRGLGLRVQRFTDPFRQKEVDLAVVQGQWRELGACMRSMSHALQVCIVVLALTVGTGLIAVAFDVLRDGFALTMLPAVLFFALLTATLLPAALASSACARFPSFVAIYDPGPEMAEQFIRFADFVAMTDCGCFLWDTKLTLGLLQRVISITIALAAGIYRSGILAS